jgi:hypothetical protein
VPLVASFRPENGEPIAPPTGEESARRLGGSNDENPSFETAAIVQNGADSFKYYGLAPGVEAKAGLCRRHERRPRALVRHRSLVVLRVAAVRWHGRLEGRGDARARRVTQLPHNIAFDWTTAGSWRPGRR